MTAIVMSLIVVLVSAAVLLSMGVLGLIAEYSENPVISIVEEYRKKYSNTNEN